MPEKLEPAAGKTKTWIFALLGILVVAGAVCVCGGFTVGLPAFRKYVARSKALEAETKVSAIAVGAKSHFDANCEFPSPAGPLPPLMDCCEDTCRRTTAQTRQPGWDAVGFDTNQPYRFEYVTVVEEGRFIARARGDLDCDGERSLYQIVVEGDRDACTATVGTLTKEQPFE